MVEMNHLRNLFLLASTSRTERGYILTVTHMRVRFSGLSVTEDG